MVLAVALLIGACGDPDAGPDADADADLDADTDADSDSDTDSDTTPDPRCDSELPQPTGEVRLNQIFFTIDVQDFVELENVGALDQSLTGWILATSPSRSYAFAAGLIVPAGGCITLYWGPNDPCEFGTEACGVGGFVNDLRASTGDVAIFLADDLDCPDALVDYVRWGAPEAEVDSTERIAIDAREWPEAETVDTTTWAEGFALQYDDSGEAGGAHWTIEEGPRRCD